MVCTKESLSLLLMLLCSLSLLHAELGVLLGPVPHLPVAHPDQQPPLASLAVHLSILACCILSARQAGLHPKCLLVVLLDWQEPHRSIDASSLG